MSNPTSVRMANFIHRQILHTVLNVQSLRSDLNEQSEMGKAAVVAARLHQTISQLAWLEEIRDTDLKAGTPESIVAEMTNQLILLVGADAPKSQLAFQAEVLAHLIRIKAEG